MTEPRSTFILRVIMAESGSPLIRMMNTTLPFQAHYPLKLVKRYALSWLSLEMEVLSYHFKPDLPGTDIDGSVYPSAVSPEIEALYVDCVGNTDW